MLDWMRIGQLPYSVGQLIKESSSSSHSSEENLDLRLYYKFLGHNLGTAAVEGR
jgi:hypothetical protein